MTNPILFIAGLFSVLIAGWNFSKGRIEYSKYGKTYAVIADRSTEPNKFYGLISVHVAISVFLMIGSFFLKS